MSHTPGPWHAVEGGQVRAADDTPICDVAGYGTTEENTANDQLIAAAPDLLESLTEMLNQYRNSNGVDAGWRKRMHDNAAGAIAKAHGEQP